MPIRKIISFGSLALLFLAATLGLRMNTPILLLFDLPLCLVIIFACANNIPAWVIISLVGGIFSDAVASTIIPIHTILYFVTGYILMQLMKTRLAQRSLLAVILSSIIATTIAFIVSAALFLISVTQWPSDVIFKGLQEVFFSGIISVLLHISISVLGVGILRYSPPEFRLRPYKTRL